MGLADKDFLRFTPHSFFMKYSLFALLLALGLTAGRAQAQDKPVLGAPPVVVPAPVPVPAPDPVPVPTPDPVSTPGPAPTTPA